MNNSDKEIVSALRRILAERIGVERFALWFGSPQSLRVEDDELVVAARDQFSLERVRSRFGAELEAACSSAAPRLLKIRYCIDPSQRPAVAAARDGGPDMAAPAAAPAPAPRDRARQLASLDSFVVGDSNRVAHTAAVMTARQPGCVTPLFLYGPTGCGKTHLLEGIWKAFRAGHRGRAIMLSAEQFTSHFLEALRGSGLPSFRRRYRGLDLLLIDDVHFFLGKRATLVELQHTVDTLLRERRQVVLSADRAPGELPQVGPELVTRLSGGLVCALQPPEQQTRLGIARLFCRQRNYNFSDQVLQWVAAQLRGDARQLSGALNRLHATGQALGTAVTLELAQSALADLIHNSGPPVRIADIERAVCDVFGLERKALQSGARSRAVTQPRTLAMWLARKYTRAAYSEIGQYFGRRSHSTVISAQRKVEAWIQSGQLVQLAHGTCPVADVIHRVETRLNAG